MVFATDRLVVRLAELRDAARFHRLWSDSRVMTNVGFPRGLGTTLEEIQQRLSRLGNDPLDQLLSVVLNENGEWIGECRLGTPDETGTSRTDVKLLPTAWGHRYGIEVKRGLLEYLFTRTGCHRVEAGPNVGNIASIRMQEAVGGRPVGEGHHDSPESLGAITTPVHCVIYRVTREAWARGECGDAFGYRAP